MGPNLTISHLQFMQCTKSLVNQTGMINTQTGSIIGRLDPVIKKNHSTWQVYNEETSSSSQDPRLVGGPAVCQFILVIKFQTKS
jgi:hypothetical protein